MRIPGFTTAPTERSFNAQDFKRNGKLEGIDLKSATTLVKKAVDTFNEIKKANRQVAGLPSIGSLSTKVPQESVISSHRELEAYKTMLQEKLDEIIDAFDGEDPAITGGSTNYLRDAFSEHYENNVHDLKQSIRRIG